MEGKTQVDNEGFWVRCSQEFLAQWPFACGTLATRPILIPRMESDSEGFPRQEGFYMDGHEHLMARHGARPVPVFLIDLPPDYQVREHGERP